MAKDLCTVNFDTSGLDYWLDNLGEASNESVRPAAQAGAQVLYQAAIAHVPVGVKAHVFHGTHAKYLFDAGTLKRSIYQVYSKDHSGVDHATFHIAWNHRKAPYGFMVEFGTSRAPAHPFLWPAYQSQHMQALEASRDKYFELMQAKVPEAAHMSIAATILALMPAALSGRVYPVVAPASVAGDGQPYATYQRVGGLPIAFMDQAVPSMVNGTYLVKVWSTRYVQTSALQEAVEQAFILAGDLTAAVLTRPIDAWEEETKLFGSIQQFAVWSDRDPLTP